MIQIPLKSKRILFFIQNGLGGAERVQLEIARMLLDDGWHVEFCMISFESENRIKKFYPANVEQSEIFAHSQIGLLKDIYLEIKEAQPDVVFASAMHLNQRILIVSLLFPGIKFVVRNENYLYTIPYIKRRTLALTYKKANAIISQTEEMEDELIKLGIKKDKIRTIYNPINERTIREKAQMISPFPNDDKIRFVALGRFARQKGFDILVEAYAIVSEKIPESELFIVGDTSHYNGSVFAELKQLVEKYKLSKKVFFTGFKENPYPYIKNCNVFVLSSRYEGLPNVLIEALFLGKPCAATTCIPIISRIIFEGKNGYLASSENPSELADAMLKASNMTEIISTYKPGSDTEFLSLFNGVLE